jgi:hypothetical protein
VMGSVEPALALQDVQPRLSQPRAGQNATHKSDTCAAHRCTTGSLLIRITTFAARTMLICWGYQAWLQRLTLIKGSKPRQTNNVHTNGTRPCKILLRPASGKHAQELTNILIGDGSQNGEERE